MVCRASRASSAVVTFARDMSGLQDNQVLGLNHALMQEGNQTPAPTQQQWNDLITDLQNRYRAGLLTMNPGSHDPVGRLEAARTETPNGPRYYALQRLVERASAANEAQSAYLNDFARESGHTVQSAQVQFNQAFSDASANSRVCATPAFVQAWLANPDHTNLPIDRRSLYAFEQMETARNSSLAAAELRPVVSQTWEFPADENGRGRITHLAYDPISGHTEISWVREGGQPLNHVYREIPAEIISLLVNPTELSREDVFRQSISGNRSYRYASREEAEAARYARRCNSCGQFTAENGHACPPIGSDEALNRDTRLVVEQSNNGTATEEPYRVAGNGTRRYALENGTVRIPGVSRIAQDARNHGIVQAPVHALISGYAVTGLAQIEYNGRGNGYTVSAVTNPGDSGRNQLRCTCAAFRATNTCEHSVGALEGIAQTMGLGTRVSPSQATAANTTVTEQLTTENTNARRRVQQAAAAFIPNNTKLEEQPELFQELYQAARDKRTEWKDNGGPFPIEYVTENALGGIAQRGSGRGFGIELEFAFPTHMSHDEREDALNAIGAALYSTGLTRNERQTGYGASHGWYRDQHERGWSFEDDPTTGGDQYGGGEIVSPVMFDEPKTWESIKKVCDVLREHGAIFSTGSGMHVHVGVGDYDHEVDNHNRLLQQLGENEDLLYRMSANPVRGRHRGRGYCAPNNLASNPYSSVQNAAYAQAGHGLALNLQSVAGRRSDHVEFRTFDSTLEPAVIQTQIAFAVLMTEGAVRGVGTTTPSGERQPIGTRLNANPSRGTLTGEQWKESTLGIRRFIDRMVPGITEAPKDNHLTRQLVGLFAMTKWQGRRNRTETNE